MADELTMTAVVDAILEAGLRNNNGGEYLTPETPLREIHYKGGDRSGRNFSRGKCASACKPTNQKGRQMRIIINIDAVKDQDRIGKKTVRVRTCYYFSSGDELRVQNCGVEIYNILKEGFGRGFEGGLIIHEGEKK